MCPSADNWMLRKTAVKTAARCCLVTFLHPCFDDRDNWRHACDAARPFAVKCLQELIDHFIGSIETGKFQWEMLTGLSAIYEPSNCCDFIQFESSRLMSLLFSVPTIRDVRRVTWRLIPETRSTMTDDGPNFAFKRQGFEIFWQTVERQCH